MEWPLQGSDNDIVHDWWSSLSIAVAHIVWPFPSIYWWGLTSVFQMYSCHWVARWPWPGSPLRLFTLSFISGLNSDVLVLAYWRHSLPSWMGRLEGGALCWRGPSITSTWSVLPLFLLFFFVADSVALMRSTIGTYSGAMAKFNPQFLLCSV